MALDLSGDWIVFDNIQTVMYQSRINDTSFGTPTSCIGLKREDEKGYDEGMLGSGSVELSQLAAIWEVWEATLTNVVPKRGDQFKASTVTGVTTWTVDSVDYSTFTTRYRLHCRQTDSDS
jgi:hypothetical protein